MVVYGDEETGNIYGYRIQLPQEENEAGGISGNHGRDYPPGWVSLNPIIPEGSAAVLPWELKKCCGCICFRSGSTYLTRQQRMPSMTATPFPLFLCCPLKLYSAPGIAGGSPWYNQQKNLGRWIVRPRFFALAESNRQEADCSAPWIAFVWRFSPAEIFTFFPIPFHQRVRVPGGALEVAVSGEKGEEGSGRIL